jgi:hypothetical protein
MIALPALVYRCPGPYVGPPGTTYDARRVSTESERLVALGEGWHATLPQAVEAFLAEPEEDLSEHVDEPNEPVSADDDAPPTRAEMLAKADEIGLRVDKRWSDRTLAARLAEAIG